MSGDLQIGQQLDRRAPREGNAERRFQLFHVGRADGRVGGAGRAPHRRIVCADRALQTERREPGRFQAAGRDDAGDHAIGAVDRLPDDFQCGSFAVPLVITLRPVRRGPPLLVHAAAVEERDLVVGEAEEALERIDAQVRLLHRVDVLDETVGVAEAAELLVGQEPVRQHRHDAVVQQLVP